jgi:glycosyltransferase involved in cell wall biosynthesis
VTVAGYVQDVRTLYREADIFVMPSLEEGGPQVTYEAAAHGVSIIASPMGASRMGESGECLMVVDPYDTDAMASALTRLATSDEERAIWGARARAAVQSYDWPLVGMDRARKLNERFRN